MNLETTQWLLEGAHAFQKDPKLKSWNNLQRDYFIWLLTSIFKVETLEEALLFLEQVVTGELIAPSLPPNLKTLVENWEKAKTQRAEIQKETAEKVAQFIAKQQALLIEEQQRLAIEKPEPVLPLAEAAKEATKEIPKKKVITPSPPEVFPKEEGVAFAPIFTLLQPKVAFAFTKKVVLAPVVKAIQFADRLAGEELPVEAAKTVPEERQTVSEFRELLHQGLTARDIETSIEGFQEAGVPPDHPKLVELEKKRIRLESYEKAHRLLTGIFKQYHEFSKITGRRQIYLPEISAYLPRLSQLPVWVKKRGYSWTLRQTLTKIGTGLRLYQKLPLAPEKTVIHFSLPDTLTRIVTLGKVKTFQTVKVAIYQKAIKPILVRLRKTGIGKAAAWVLTKLGLAVLPEPVSKIIFVASLVWDAIKLGWGLLKRGLRRLSDRPIETVILGAILGTIGFFIFAPLPLKLLFLGAGLFLGALGFIGGLAKWVGGLISGAGSFLSGAFSAVGGFISSLTTISLPSSLPILAVGGAIGATAGLTIFVLSAVSTAFMLPGREEIVGSPYIDVTKNVMPKTQYANDELPVTVTYTIIVMAKQAKLINVKVDDQTSITKDGPAPSVPPRSWDVPEISGTWSQTYDLELTRPDFEDSLVTNVVTVTADIEGGPTGQTASTSLTIIIGSPPEDCPSGWPTSYGYITQGPDGGYSHPGQEAIDIGVDGIINTPAYATHRGTITVGYGDSGAGNWVQVSGICQGKTIITQYFHLETVSVKNNQEVHRGIQVGGVGETGCPGCGIHLHYEFAQNLAMEPPYIPVRVPGGCSSYNECGKIEW